MALRKGKEHPGWKGNKATYSALHRRVYRAKGKACTCDMPGCTKKSKKFEWASLTNDYTNLDDYKSMCISCHRLYDGMGTRRPGNAKLDPAKVRQIRAMHHKATVVKIARMFSVSVATIKGVLYRRYWKDV